MLKKDSHMIPVKHCLVRLKDGSGTVRIGRVESVDGAEKSGSVGVRWLPGTDSSRVPVERLGSGFKASCEVMDCPRSRARKSLGEGVVVKQRSLGGREQVLVDFLESGTRVWLPFENLRQIKGTRTRFVVGDPGPEDAAERYRLRTLAHAIEIWNENTGSLSGLDIDPLPHQIHLVHHILASGDLNWLIADDVGLGKTIETGMLLAALRQRGQLGRVLLVTPAGLTKQWQEELNFKFKMGEFRIYGEDFVINEPRHWKMYDYVIASIDRLKSDRHMEAIAQAGSWDIIIFDEAHRLSRKQYGLKYDYSQRFHLASQLRSLTDSLLLLSATPHQGKTDKFQALLELLHPERKDEITTLALNPEIIGDMVYRNNKADVTDADGNFIFKGVTTKAIPVDVSEKALRFDKKLREYVIRGYAAGSAMGTRGNAIGFVMTVYRKLAASSIAAIKQALVNRRERLQGRTFEERIKDLQFLEERDQRFRGEWEEELATVYGDEFFEGEMAMLEELIDAAEELRTEDLKLQSFLEDIVEAVIRDNPDNKLLIFTEYRTTQEYLRSALAKRYGTQSVGLINGSMSHQERRATIASFEDELRFLISTEAGGEGINLQRKCHMMVNYDLPWNPMRLVQRIGRLYRYGQEKRVFVFNIYSPTTADEQIMDLMYTKLDQVVNDLAGVSSEFNERLRDDILGEVADLMDVESILKEGVKEGIERTKERIDEALRRAREAAQKQRELFDYASSYDPNETGRELRIDKEHVQSFVLGMFSMLGIEIVKRTHDNRIWSIRLPEAVRDELLIGRTRYDVTLDRDLAAARPDTHMLDLDSFLMNYLIAKAKSYEFMGQTAILRDSQLNGSAILSALLRWQNEQGKRMRQEYAAFQVFDDGRVQVNSDAFSRWLLFPAVTGQERRDREANKKLFSEANSRAQERLQEISSRHLHPENIQWISGAWLENP
jgi:ERCC4-related helicase